MQGGCVCGRRGGRLGRERRVSVNRTNNPITRVGLSAQNLGHEWRALVPGNISSNLLYARFTHFPTRHGLALLCLSVLGHFDNCDGVAVTSRRSKHAITRC